MTTYKMDIPDDMNSLIHTCAALLGGAGIIGGLIAPGTDAAAIIAVWIRMTYKLAKEAGSTMSEQQLKKIAMATFTGASMFIGGTKAAATIFGWLAAPFTLGASLLVNVSANVALNVAFTEAYGRAVARLFLQETEISNIDVAVRMIISSIGADMGF